jgi:hypothetical protein
LGIAGTDGADKGAEAAMGGLGIAGAEGSVAPMPGFGETGMLKGFGGGGGKAEPVATGTPGFGGAGMVGGAPAMVGRGLGGRLIMAASRGLAAPGFPSRRGGRTMRTVSFLGSFMAGVYDCWRVGVEPLDEQEGEDYLRARGCQIFRFDRGSFVSAGKLALAYAATARHST